MAADQAFPKEGADHRAPGAFLGFRRLSRILAFAAVILLFLLWVRAPNAAPARATTGEPTPGVVQSFSNATASAQSQLVLSPSSATTLGNLLVVVVEVRTTAGVASVTGVSDTSGNTWLKATSVLNKRTDAELWYAADAASIPPSGAITTATAASASIAATALEVSDIATSAPLDVTSRNIGTNASPSTGATIATTEASEVAIAAIGWDGLRAPTNQTAGYAPLAAAKSNVSHAAVSEQAASAVLASTGPQQYAATLSGPLPWTAIIATFMTAAEPPPTPTPSPSATPSGTPNPNDPITHVVVIYQENHSFDNLLGDWCFSSSRCDGINPAQPVRLAGAR